MRSIVEGLEQRTLFSIFTVINTDDTGGGSLNQAITDANNHANSLNAGSAPDEIDFKIPGTGVHTITPSTMLPDVSDAVFINGYSQPGASANTLATGDDAVILIELRGTNLVTGDNGLNIDASNTVVRGLAIGGFTALPNTPTDSAGGNGITTDQHITNITIAGNFLGLNAAGDTAFGCEEDIFGDASSSTIGGLTPADRNVISNGNGSGALITGTSVTIQGNYFGTDATGGIRMGNKDAAVVLTAGASLALIGGNTAAARNVLDSTGFTVQILAGAHDNKVQGNYIGTNATATGEFDSNDAVWINSGSNNLIGGSGAGEGNVIVGGETAGVAILRILDNVIGPDSTGNIVQGNRIGISPTGIRLPNEFGVITEGCSGNTIGGNEAGEGNIIANSIEAGVAIGGVATLDGNNLTHSTDDLIVGNSIYGNGKLGIDLLTGPREIDQGVTPDDAGDTDTGSNNLQNKPNITQADYLNGHLTVSGNFQGSGSGTLKLDVYVNDAPDPSGFGQGKTYLGQFTISNGSGVTSFGPIDVSATLSEGQWISGTLTDSAGNTSEFSNDKDVVPTDEDPFCVRNTNDSGSGSLRQAILNANAHPNVSGVPDVICFEISGTGVHTITPATPLPDLTDPFVMDGYVHQTGASANTLASGNNAKILIEISGAKLASGTDALRVAVDNSTIRGLTIDKFLFGNAIHILPGHTGDVVEGSFIGTTPDGSAAGFNPDTFESQNYGVFLDAAPLNTVGGTTPQQRNLISGNSVGVEISGTGAISNLIEGNYIGPDAAGTSAFLAHFTGGSAALQKGVEIKTSGNTVGGTSAAARNLISGNATGIVITGSGATGNFVKGNYIGTTADASAALANNTGISLLGPTNTIGGTTAGARNIISGNGDGIDINGVSGETIQGNYIGSDVAGNVVILNGTGIDIVNSPNNLIGGTVVSARNLISGNIQEIRIDGLTSANNTIQGNYIGTNAAGTQNLGNVLGGYGIAAVSTGAIIIGGTDPGAGNVIAGHLNANITLYNSSGSVIQGNYIGVDATGTVGLAGNVGIELNSCANVQVGGAIAAARNIISGNAASGIEMDFDAASGIKIQGNYIGTDVTGKLPIPNGTANASFTGGIFFFGASNDVIGGVNPGEGNIIAFNVGNGITVTNSNGAGTGNMIEGNSIFSNTKLGIDLNNDGVTSVRDAGDTDTGPNGLQNIPVIVSATADAFSTKVHVTLINPASKTYRVEFFSNNTADSSGFGEGQTYLGFANITTDSAGNADTTITLPVSVALGKFITATVTGTDGTSEFSAAVVAANPSPTVTINKAADQADPTSTSPVLFTVTFSAPVTGFTGSDVTLSGTAGATTAVVTGGPSVYTVSVSGMTASGTVIATIAAGAALDSNSTASSASTSTDNTVMYNKPIPVAPTVTINKAAGQGDPTSTSPVLFSVIFSTNISGFTDADIDLSSSTAGGPLVVTVTQGADKAHYTVSVSGMTTSGDVIANIPAAAAIDSNGTLSAASTSTDNTVAYNQPVAVTPTVTINKAGGQADPTSTSPILFSVVFSTNVTGFDASDVDLSTSTTGGTLVAIVTQGADAAHYTISVSGMTTFGDVIATIPAAAAVGGNGTPSAASTSADNSVAYTVAVPTPPSVAINDVTHSEGNSGTTSFVFTVTRSGDPTVPFTVDFETADGTATVTDNDYVAKTGTLMFNAGDTTQTITVFVNGDTNVESDETFTVTLSNFQMIQQAVQQGTAQPAGVVDPIARAIGTGTIKNDDAVIQPIKPALKINDVTMNEGNSGTTNFTFTVTRSGDTSGKTTVKYATADGTAKSSSDYSSKSGTITFNAGEKTKSITIAVHGDTTIESDETFNVVLSSAVNATIADGTGVGTIKNDDAKKLPTLSINDVTKAEGDAAETPFTFTITRSGDLSGKSTVNFTTVMGSAPTGTNGYFPRNGSITFAPGEKTKTITVQIDAGTLIEPDETFKVVLSNPSGATISDGTGVGTILNDDTAITIGDVKVKEGKNGKQAVQVTISLVEHTTKTVTVNYKTADSTAKAGSDYVAASGMLTFKPGETSKTITIFIDGDTQTENDETFFINLSSAVNATIADKQGILTILNDD